MGGGLWLTRRLPTLLGRYPGPSVELVMRDHLGDMIEERLDLATIEGEVTDSSLVSRRIGALTHLLVAAPTYLERSGPRAQRASSAAGLERSGAPTHPDDLAHHECYCPSSRARATGAALRGTGRPDDRSGIRSLQRQ